jgi:NACalpha-BTF3-like transcription factor
MVMEQAGCSEEQAREALEKSGGDIAQAILSLSEGKE